MRAKEHTARTPKNPKPRPRLRARLGHALIVSVLLLIGLVAVASRVGWIGLDAVTSDSMSCKASKHDDCFNSGALIVTVPVPGDKLQVGDIAVLSRDSGVVVAHRVIEVKRESDGKALVRLQGDAVPSPDPMPYAVTQAGKVVWSAEVIGVPLYKLFSPPYIWLLLVGALLAIASYLLWPSKHPKFKAPTHPWLREPPVGLPDNQQDRFPDGPPLPVDESMLPDHDAPVSDWLREDFIDLPGIGGVPDAEDEPAGPAGDGALLCPDDPDPNAQLEHARHEGTPAMSASKKGPHRESAIEPWLLGHEVADDGPVHVDMAAGAHLLIAGATRSGKSVATHSLIAQMLRMGDSVRLLVADPNGTMIAPFEDSVAWSTSSVEAEPVTEMLRWVRWEMDRRKPILREMEQDKIEPHQFSPELPLIVVVIDEAANYMRASGARDLKPELLAVVQQGAKYGIRVVLITQRPDSTILDTNIRAQFSARISFRAENKQTAQLVFPDVKDPSALLQLPPGVGFVRQVGQDVKRFRGLYLTDPWKTADDIGTRQPKINVRRGATRRAVRRDGRWIRRFFGRGLPTRTKDATTTYNTKRGQS